MKMYRNQYKDFGNEILVFDAISPISPHSYVTAIFKPLPPYGEQMLQLFPYWHAIPIRLRGYRGDLASVVAKRIINERNKIIKDVN